MIGLDTTGYTILKTKDTGTSDMKANDFEYIGTFKVHYISPDTSTRSTRYVPTESSDGLTKEDRLKLFNQRQGDIITPQHPRCVLWR